MNYTKKYKLKKPEETDYYNVDDGNYNADRIDEELSNLDAKKHEHSNKSILDKITQILLDQWNSAYTHISDAVKHITSDERTKWNTVSNKVDKISGKELSTNDFTDAYKTKLDGLQSALDGKLPHFTITAADTDFNALKTTGVYHIRVATGTNQPTSTHGTLYVDFTIGTQVQLWIPDIRNNMYKRTYTVSSSTWSSWTELKLTDTWRGIQNNLTSDSTSESLSAAQGKVLKKLIDGKAASSHTHNYAGSSSPGGDATSANKLRDYSHGTRLTSANLAASTNGTGSIFGFVATSSMTTGKPPGDSYILQMNWDTVAGYDSQLAIGNGDSNGMYFRSQSAGTWQSWKTVLDSSNYKTYCTPANIGAAATSHTHNYAGSSSVGGSAASAVKLDSSAGSVTQPVYFSDGKPVACTYTLGKSVPSNAAFTDTIYTHPEYTARTGVPTANVSPQHGASFNVSQPVVDETGHVTALNQRTISVPNVFVGAAAKTSNTYTLNTSQAYMIIGTGHASSGNTDSLSCGEYIYYDNSKWNRTRIFASTFPGLSISGNTLTIKYSSTTYSCDHYILLRVK